MKLTKSLILISALFTLISTAHATQSGEEIFNAKCSACHSTTRPADMSKVVAPALMGVMRHLKMDYPDKTKAVAFIKDYALNPTKEKAICMPKKIERFGLMPSQKGNITEEELEVVAAWMFDNFPPADFKGMGQGNRKQAQATVAVQPTKMNALKTSPFLMNQDTLPHLTKMLIESWDKGTLNLSAEQKTKLLVVRTETMTGVKKVKKALRSLETEIIEMTVDDEAFTDIQPKVEEVAKLKAEATMIHLKCLRDSIEILNDEQVELLLPFWGV